MLRSIDDKSLAARLGLRTALHYKVIVHIRIMTGTVKIVVTE